MMELSTLPGEGPPVPGRCNCDSETLSGAEMQPLWAGGSADEAVVAVKVRADEDTVTYLRVKLSSSDPAVSRVGGEGRNMCSRFDVFIRNHR
jgi:hypothetical protein